MEKGSKMTKESIDKIKQNRKGKGLDNTNGFKKGHHSINEFKKGIVPWNKGIQTKKHSQETKNLMSLGLFFDKKEAAIAYDTAAKKYHKEFAKLNY